MFPGRRTEHMAGLAEGDNGQSTMAAVLKYMAAHPKCEQCGGGRPIVFSRYPAGDGPVRRRALCRACAASGGLKAPWQSTPEGRRTMARLRREADRR
jgi:hypothetical protein